MDLSSKVLSDLTIFMKYAKYDKNKKRRETWEELVTRNKNMHIKKFPNLKEEIEKAYQFVYDKKVLPSMRSLQFAGKPIEINPTRLFNCSFAPIDNWRIFGEIMFLLLGGTGVGYSVQYHHVDKLPIVRKPLKRKRRFLITDSIEGWAQSIEALMRSYFFGHSDPVFDFSDIREKGSPLITSGGKAPGPQPLKDCIHNIRKILDEVEEGEKLIPLQVHEIICYIADGVLAGGIRRAALIALFSMDDNEMLTCKHGNWWETKPHLGRANNSAVILRHRIKRKEFMRYWERIKEGGFGEPAVFWTADKEYGLNPCSEISLQPCSFCNLTTINADNITDQSDLNERVSAAAFIGTLQASYTDFHYLRDVWENTTKKDSLLGVSMTGVANEKIKELNLKEAAECVVEENKRVSKLLGIKSAARLTCVKPEGSSSCVLGTSSGIHAWFAPYYIRRIRVNKNESVYKYLKKKIPKLVEDDYFKPHIQAVISLPVKAPEGAIFRDEDVMEFLQRIKRFSQEWITPGHRKGENKHNVSSTVFLKDNEWEKVGKWMWDNREHYTGITVLPYDGGSYKQAPFEEITKDQYDELYKYLKEINLSEIKEEDDETNLQGVVACAGGACEIKYL